MFGVYPLGVYTLIEKGIIENHMIDWWHDTKRNRYKTRCWMSCVQILLLELLLLFLLH